jgi:hypothetical protein
MLTTEQIKKLEELGFKTDSISYWDKPSRYRKQYAFDVYIHVYTDGSSMFHMIGKYPQAQHDLDLLCELAEKVEKIQKIYHKWSQDNDYHSWNAMHDMIDIFEDTNPEWGKEKE